MGTIQKKIGEKVKRLRQDRELTQQKLAEKIKMDITTINEIENGRRNPSVKTINKLARALKVNPSELLIF